MYSSEEVLRIEVPLVAFEPPHFGAFFNKHSPSPFEPFTDRRRKNHIKSLFLVQEDYKGHHHYRHNYSAVKIPNTIANLTAVETISITANIETLPNSLCRLKKLQLLDLTGCYNILSIPSEVLAMPNLKIKIGEVISPASEVAVIPIPKKGISKDQFSVLADRNKGKISQLIIHQEC